MEMLEPKVKEIQEKFGKGEKLSLGDFNLLLLKTQYNHLNHLDQKLDEVAADVGAAPRGEDLRGVALQGELDRPLVRGRVELRVGIAAVAIHLVAAEELRAVAPVGDISPGNWNGLGSPASVMVRSSR